MRFEVYKGWQGARGPSSIATSPLRRNAKRSRSSCPWGRLLARFGAPGLGLSWPSTVGSTTAAASIPSPPGVVSDTWVFVTFRLQSISVICMSPFATNNVYNLGYRMSIMHRHSISSVSRVFVLSDFPNLQMSIQMCFSCSEDCHLTSTT